jgi:hypothetical protein
VVCVLFLTILGCLRLDLPDVTDGVLKLFSSGEIHGAVHNLMYPTTGLVASCNAVNTLRGVQRGHQAAVCGTNQQSCGYGSSSTAVANPDNNTDSCRHLFDTR